MKKLLSLFSHKEKKQNDKKNGFEIFTDAMADGYLASVMNYTQF